MNHPPIVFIDVETTGGRAGHSKVIDIGAIRVEKGKVVKRMNQLINPERPIPNFIKRLTGITNDMVWAAPKFETVAPELEDLLNGAIFTAHYVDFDYSLIKKEFKRIGVEFNRDRACTVKMSRILHPEYSRHGLDMIIERMELMVINRHRGYDDAEVLMHFFQRELQYNAYELLTTLAKSTIRTRKIKVRSKNQLSIL